jgi:septal ring-binding cell division protein DamX
MMSSLAKVTSAHARHVTSAETAHVTSAEAAHVPSAAEATHVTTATATAAPVSTATAAASTTACLRTCRKQRRGKHGGCQYLHRSSSHYIFLSVARAISDR